MYFYSVELTYSYVVDSSRSTFDYACDVASTYKKLFPDFVWKPNFFIFCFSNIIIIMHGCCLL